MAEQQDETYFNHIMPSQLSQCDGQYVKLNGKIQGFDDQKMQLVCIEDDKNVVAQIENFSEDAEIGNMYQIRGYVQQNVIQYSEGNKLNDDFDLNAAYQALVIKQQFNQMC